MSGGTVRIERSGAVAWLTLQRPEALNAFSKFHLLNSCMTMVAPSATGAAMPLV